MIALVSRDETLLARVKRLLGPVEVVPVNGIEHLRAAPSPLVLLVDLDYPDLGSAELRGWTASPLSPPCVVIAQSFEGRALQLLAAGHFPGLLTVRELNRLPSVVRRVRERHALRLAARRIDSQRELPRALRGALKRAVTDASPFRTVEALARAERVHPSTLYQELRDSPADLGLKEILDWILILRARAAKDRLRSWKRVAHSLDTPMRTLQRVSRRRLGGPLSELERISPHELLGSFEEEVIGPLCADGERIRHFDVHSPSLSLSRRPGRAHRDSPRKSHIHPFREAHMPKARVAPAKIDLREVPVRELEAELARSRILAAAARHIIDQGIDTEAISFSLDFSLDW